MQFKALGNKVTQPSRELETFLSPGPLEITFSTSEFTALCPITGQPDYAEITITYFTRKVCLESKSLKLYLMSYRNEGAFCESLCIQIASDLIKALDPEWLAVTIKQNARGGIGLNATHTYARKHEQLTS